MALRADPPQPNWLDLKRDLDEQKFMYRSQGGDTELAQDLATK